MYHWNLLAKEKYSEIKGYIYEELIKIPFEGHCEQYRKLHSGRKMHSFHVSGGQENRKHYEESREELIRSLYRMMNEKDKDQQKQELKPPLSQGDEFHDLYVQTYAACDGPKYVVYDY